MTRVNRYRAWDEDTGIMIYPHQGLNNKNFFCGFQSYGRLEVSKYVGKGSWKILPLMQFIGLHDKNGIEICEGDIIFEPLNNINGLITYKCGAFGFEFNNKKQWLSFTSCPDLQVTVIGNIHEHKHLLEAAE